MREPENQVGVIYSYLSRERRNLPASTLCMHATVLAGSRPMNMRHATVTLFHLLHGAALCIYYV